MISRTTSLYRTLRQGRNLWVIKRKSLRAVHRTAYVHQSCNVDRDLVAHEYVFVGRECSIGAMTEIGAYSMLAPRVAVVGDDHIHDSVGTPIQFSGRPPQQITKLGRDTWIGYGSIIIRGVTIGEGAIVAAGSVVTKSVPDYEIWAGVPARKLRDRFSELQRMEHKLMLDSRKIRPTFVQNQREGTP